jgi:hypothetical protein
VVEVREAIVGFRGPAVLRGRRLEGGFGPFLRFMGLAFGMSGEFVGGVSDDGAADHSPTGERTGDLSGPLASILSPVGLPRALGGDHSAVPRAGAYAHRSKVAAILTADCASLDVDRPKPPLMPSSKIVG